MKFLLNAKEIIFNPLLSRIIQRDVTTLQSNTAIIQNLQNVLNGLWKEVANAYSELNDPIDQRERLKSKCVCLKKGDDEANGIIDEDLRLGGMPPTSGLGIGMDRLMMYLTTTTLYSRSFIIPSNAT
jgi:lysyl-tRNA synthetase class 2